MALVQAWQKPVNIVASAGSFKQKSRLNIFREHKSRLKIFREHKSRINIFGSIEDVVAQFGDVIDQWQGCGSSVVGDVAAQWLIKPCISPGFDPGFLHSLLRGGRNHDCVIYCK
jgi:hypothetical protein